MSKMGKRPPQRSATGARRAAPTPVDAHAARPRPALIAALFENARDGVLALNEEGTVLLVNPAFARLLGYATPQEFMRCTDNHPEAILQAAVGRRTDAARAEGGDERVPATLALRHRDGSPVWVSLRAHRIEENAGAFIACFVQKVPTPRAEAGLLNGLGKAIEDIDVALWCEAPDGTIETWSRGATTLTGRTRLEAVGQTAATLLFPAGRPDRGTALARSGDGDASRVEAQMRTRSGSMVDVTATRRPIRAKNGDLIGTVVTVHNAPQRRTEEATRLALAQQEQHARTLHEVTRGRQEFIDQAVHALKTPLTPLVTHLQVLKGKGGWDGAALKSLQIIDRNATRMASLVNDLTDASWLTADRFRLERRPTEMRRLVRDVVESFYEHAAGEGVAIETQIDASVIVSVDRARLTQVLFNLLSNAIKFTPRGGTVHIGLTGEGNEAALTVRDTGVGLSPEHLKKLFRPFAVFHPGRNSGTGLGLFISKGIIEAHGGTMWAESDGPGKGTSLGFRLPRPAPHAQSPTAWHRPPSGRTGSSVPQHDVPPDASTWRRGKQRDGGGRP